MDKTLSGKPNIMTTTLRLLYIDNILYNYINTTRKEKGLCETVCSHRPPLSAPLAPPPPGSATVVLGLLLGVVIIMLFHWLGQSNLVFW